MKAVFIYAKQDVKYFKNLKKHLHVPTDLYSMKVVAHEHPNTFCFENDINDADIVFLLVSVNSFNTLSWIKYADLAIKKHKPKNSVIPIRIDNTSWSGKSFYGLSHIPTKGRSISDFKPQKDAFIDIETAIIKLSERIYEDIRKAKRLKKERKDAEDQQMQINLQKQRDFQLGIIIFVIFIAPIIFLIGKSITNSNITKCSAEIEAEIYLQRGDNEEKRYNLQKAIEGYRCAIYSRPNYYEAYGKRGKMYFDEGNYELAIGDFTKALEDKDLQTADLVFFLHRRGEANRKIWEATQNDKNKKDALKNYDKVIEIQGYFILKIRLRVSSPNAHLR